MKPKFLYLIPLGGLNDILTGIGQAHGYAKKYGRTLLISGKYTTYRVNFADYFRFVDGDIICDQRSIDAITSDPALSSYPIGDSHSDRFLASAYEYCKNGYRHKSTDTVAAIPVGDVDGDIVIVVKCGGSKFGYRTLVGKIRFTETLAGKLVERRTRIPGTYLCAQVRNTDRRCNYQAVLEEFKRRSKQCQSCYVSSDNGQVVKHFQKEIDCLNFTTFGNAPNQPLHTVSDGETSLTDALADLYIMSCSTGIVSRSKGNFITLARDCQLYGLGRCFENTAVQDCDHGGKAALPKLNRVTVIFGVLRARFSAQSLKRDGKGTLQVRKRMTKPCK
jgi:hypothetical protein